ncbi:MAG: hypothetical protein ABI851_03555 [Saprospiraceae bacterium]
MRIFLILSIFLFACYSFKGTSIDPDIKYFSIDPVEDQSSSAPSSYPVDFGLALGNKIRRESRLVLNNSKPDLKFVCRITQFNITSVAPIAGQTNAINRLTVNIDVEGINLLNEKNNWKKSFSRFEDFDANKSFSEVETIVLNNINKQLLEDIFNGAFSNW